MGTDWQPFEGGASIGSSGSERGVTVLDDWHPAGTRITLERESQTAPFAITCGLEGWFVHTVFFSIEAEAQKTFKAMKADLDEIVKIVPSATDYTREQVKAVEDAIDEFVARYQ